MLLFFQRRMLDVGPCPASFPLLVVVVVVDVDVAHGLYSLGMLILYTCIGGVLGSRRRRPSDWPENIRLWLL
jgi:hypothetical protein